MNNLNSVLIEGKVLYDLDTTGTISKFIIESRGFYHSYKTNELTEYISNFSIKCYGRLAEICNKDLVAGKEIRVVGHLAQKKLDGKTWIIAEHVEIKPVVKN
jgi:single-stranded DNA-binding protein